MIIIIIIIIIKMASFGKLFTLFLSLKGFSLSSASSLFEISAGLIICAWSAVFSR